MARCQDRLNPLQKRMAGGCNLNRPICDLVAGSALLLESCEEFDLPYGSLLAHQFLGVARREPAR